MANSFVLSTFANKMSKDLYIICGCNGAGKTTASYTVLPEILQCKEFVNADEIARGLSPFNSEDVAIEAGRLMLQRIELLLEREESFSIETTLATKSYINLVRRAQAKGFRVIILFFWLNSQNLPFNVLVNVLQKEATISLNPLSEEDMLLVSRTYSTCS